MKRRAFIAAGLATICAAPGQHYEYIVKQLKDFKVSKRTNDAGNMASVSKALSERDIEDLAHYLVSLD